jgi:hypothetical protein
LEKESFAMGMFDRLFKRDDAQAKASAQGSVPMADFLKFQEEMRKNFSGLRGQFTEVVKENEVLKKQLHQFGNRLDEIQRDQHKMGLDTRNEISKIMNIAEKVAPGITRPKTSEAVQQTRATAAQNAAASLTGRLAGPSADGDSKLKPG